MNRTAIDASYREAASTLAPQAVSEYLALSPWDLERRDEVKEIWQLKEPGGKAVGRLMLPLATDYVDFTDRFYEALLALGRINDWDANELQEQILATRADLFFVRLDQPTADGTIPIKQAETTIEAIYKMLRSSATAAASAGSVGRAQLPAVVNNFLEDDVRLGHTKRGSFIFTVAARFSDGISPEQPLAEVDKNTTAGTIFSRRVMETLAHNLEATRDITFQDSPTWSKRYDSINLGLLESLEDMAKPEGLRALELSFRWATAIAQPDVGIEPIKLEHNAIDSLSLLRRQLVPAAMEEEIRHETLVGPVLSLARESSEDEDGEAGEIVMLADVGRGRPRNVHVTLSGPDHEWAIQAYRSKLPITISGDLVFERQRWRLIGDVEVDASFLSQQLNNLPPSP